MHVHDAMFYLVPLRSALPFPAWLSRFSGSHFVSLTPRHCLLFGRLSGATARYLTIRVDTCRQTHVVCSTVSVSTSCVCLDSLVSVLVRVLWLAFVMPQYLLTLCAHIKFALLFQ